MTDYQGKIADALRATVLDPPSGFYWFGERSPQLKRSIIRSWTPHAVRNYLLFMLQTRLYSDFYCPGFAAASNRYGVALQSKERHGFIKELSSANCGSGTWEPGWTVRSIELTGLIVNGGLLEVLVNPTDAQASSGESLAPGTAVQVRSPKESLNGSPGFYIAFGDVPYDEKESHNIVRFYFNLTQGGVVYLMRQITSALNRTHIPFHFKVLSNPAQYNRCDAGVLYIQKSDYEPVADILRQLHPRLAGLLKAATPVFTKCLAHGMGLAEDPIGEESFSQHRCRLLAEGMIRAHELGKSSCGDRLHQVASTFAGAGINLEAPYLNPGSGDTYSFGPQPRLHHRRQKKFAFPDGVFLQTAVYIAQNLCQEAIWHEGCCNWLGSELVEEGDGGLQFGAAHKALGPDLYAGTSGVGLFLAEAYKATGDLDMYRTAHGAIQHALSRADAIPAPQKIGLFTGLLGVALAAARIGQLLHYDKLLEHATQLVFDTFRETRTAEGYDLLSGKAGAIIALLVLHEILGSQTLTEFAVRLGDELLHNAEVSKAGVSWAFPSGSVEHNLTGLSHGTAGVGYALLELSHAGDVPQYRRMGDKAFEYEHYWFDKEAKNWPHFNTTSGLRKQIDAPLTFVAHWCHGAPGIALSRLRAYRLFEDRSYKDEAIAGIDTTRETIKTWLDSDSANFSLCHGLAGNAEVLLYARKVLGGEWRDEEAIVEKVAHHGITTYATRKRGWPCGAGADEHPSLMLGLAGIGYFYLRLNDPTIPSILMLERENCSGGNHG